MSDQPRRGLARSVIGDTVNDPSVKAKIEALIDQALSLTGVVNAMCPNCHKPIKVEVKDVKKQLEALVVLLEQAEGKPGQEEAGVTIIVERPPLTVEA